jgi:hypothetical protein
MDCLTLITKRQKAKGGQHSFEAEARKISGNRKVTQLAASARLALSVIWLLSSKVTTF